EDFAETVSLYETVGYDAAYMFIYSARPGTPSHRHFDDLPHALKVERLQRLIEVQKRWSLERNQALVGQSLAAMLRGPAFEPSFWEGHTVGNHPVLVPEAPGVKPGLTRVRVTHATPHALYGQLEDTLKTDEAAA
ncbi:MAG TPA: tRNA (N6-isopentenyl adenosine(37)-C2)-methylthiotransferase MiaB, partial [Deinococcales bacterium]|nr:tRNA (N6-isopentenyl adenosine(37)-C2)-methylthiotransferase MiaB [Deinococcales bacterium]